MFESGLYLINAVLSGIMSYIVYRQGAKELRWMALGFLTITIHQIFLAFGVFSAFATLPLTFALIYTIRTFLYGKQRKI